jgi:hypothetical protein
LALVARSFLLSPMSFRVQEAIHKWEVGIGQRVVKATAAVLLFAGLAVWYDLRVFKGLSTREGMDAAQLGRNISRAKGFTTDLIRPFSIHLTLKKELSADADDEQSSAKPQLQDAASRINLDRRRHPDLANGPVWPVVLAGVLKVMPFDYPDLLAMRTFTVYAPDLWIVGFNQLIFLVVLVLAFRLARGLFDEGVAWMSIAVIAGTELCWGLTGAGHGTVLLIAIVLGMLTFLAKIDQLAREESGAVIGDPAAAKNHRRMFLLAAGAGLLAGLAGLTRYGVMVLIVPVVIWLGLVPSPKKATLAFIGALVFAVVTLPWFARNYTVSETPFGTATYNFAAGHGYFGGDELERSLNPDLNRIEPGQVWDKLVENVIKIDLASFAGTWATALFVIGMLVPFRNPTLGRVRWLVVWCACALAIVQALGGTALPAEEARLSGGNLMMVVGPATLIFGVGFLFVLLEGLAPAFRWLALGVTAGLVWLPLIKSLTSYHALTYYPPSIQEKAASIETSDWVMSDVPWAMAWYGDRTSVWLTVRHRDPAITDESSAATNQPPRELGNDFYSMHRLRPIAALYLAGPGLDAIRTADVAQWRGEDVAREGEDWREFLELAATLMKRAEGAEADRDTLRRLLQLADQHWAYGEDDKWGQFLLGIYVNGEVPTGFPLKRAPYGLWPELFLTETERNSGQ